MRSLKNITFAEDSKLESTGEYAFAYNDKLESIVLPCLVILVVICLIACLIFFI